MICQEEEGEPKVRGRVARQRFASLVLSIPITLALASCDRVQRQFEGATRADTVEAYSAFLAAHPTHPLAADVRRRLNDALVRRAYRWHSESGPGGEQAADLIVGERKDHTLQVTPSRIGVIPMQREPGIASPTLVPDRPGTRNVEVVVNRDLGFSTFAGVRFRQGANVNLFPDGFVEVDRDGLRAEVADPLTPHWVTARTLTIGGQQRTVLVRGLADAPSLSDHQRGDVEEAAPLATEAAVRAAAHEAIKQFPAAANAFAAPTFGRLPEYQFQSADGASVSFRLVSGIIVSITDTALEIWAQAPETAPPLEYLKFSINDKTRYCAGDLALHRSDLHPGSLVAVWAANGTLSDGKATMHTAKGRLSWKISKGYASVWADDALFPRMKAGEFGAVSVRRGLVQLDAVMGQIAGVNCDGTMLPLKL